MTDGIRYLVDDIGPVAADAHAAQSALGRLGALVEESLQRFSVGLVPDSLWMMEAWPGESLVGALSHHDQPLGRDVTVLLLEVLQRCTVLDSPATDSIELDGASRESPVAVVACARAAAGRSAALLTHGGCLLGDVSAVEASGRVTKLAYVVAVTECETFLRSVLLAESISEDELFALAPSAFRNLVFADDLKFSRFSGTYATLLPHVVAHLGVLSDHYLDAIRIERGVGSQIARRMSSMGVSMSPESPNTHANASAMRERIVRVAGEEILCEWHTKIGPTRNRIHLCAFPDAEPPHVLIGIFVDHLTI